MYFTNIGIGFELLVANKNSKKESIMRIAIEAQRIFRAKKHGMDIVALEIINALQKIDTTNEYFIFVKPGPDSNVLQETSNFKIIELPALNYISWEQIALPKAVKEYNCDILHCTSNTAPLFSSVPLVLTLHDVIFMERSIFKLRGSWYQKIGNIYRRFIVPSAVKKAQAISTVSFYEKGIISQQFPKATEKIEVVYNSVSSHFKKITDCNTLIDISKKYRLPDNGFIFFFGNTDPKKNMEGMLNAYHFLLKHLENPIPLVMTDVSRDFVYKLIEKNSLHSIKKHLQITGYINNKDLPAIYSLASVFVYPSHRESFGIPMLEAMRCETPLVCSNTSALPEIAEDSAWYANPNDYISIAFSIEKALKMSDMEKDLFTSKALNQTLNFSWEKSARSTLGIYEKVLRTIQINNSIVNFK